MSREVDEAFNWLVLILSTVSGVLVGLPETMEVKKAVALGLVPPLLVLVILWLFSHLTGRTSPKIILKSFAWFYASFMFLTFIFVFAYVTSPLFISFFFRPYTPLVLVGIAMAVFFFVAPFVFYSVAIQPKYRKDHRDSKLLASRLRPALLYILALATYLPLMIYALAGFLVLLL